jgi:hypothetical protein
MKESVIIIIMINDENYNGNNSNNVWKEIMYEQCE